MKNKYFFKVCIILGIVISVISLNGCGALRKKFVRKKKEVKEPPHYYQIQEYDIRPSIELYQKHYTYWKNWHTEIIKTLGNNSIKDKMCITEMLGHLKAMSNALIDEKAAQLNKHITKLEEIEKDINNKELTDTTISRIKGILERENRAIKRDFTYTKMGPYLRDEFKTTEEFRK